MKECGNIAGGSVKTYSDGVYLGLSARRCRPSVFTLCLDKRSHRRPLKFLVTLPCKYPAPRLVLGIGFIGPRVRLGNYARNILALRMK
ncbi:hypothetical protein J4Q44_G00343220 [Coregonus suidteri]|uniref:Uncharacterized protein n=1 Tax=Coregonus suidteri TaxID=861788 RepID=A0AAN8KU75_9TELE